MNQLEAWIVTLLGMAVVFAGLILCILAINVFNRLAKHVKWNGAHSHETKAHENQGHAAPAHAKPEVHPAPAAPLSVTPEPTPEVLAVIATALEIERRLYLGRQGQRLTLNRN